MTFNLVLTRPYVYCKAYSHVNGVITFIALPCARRINRTNTLFNCQLVVFFSCIVVDVFHSGIVNVFVQELVMNLPEDLLHLGTNPSAIDCKTKIGLLTVIHSATDVGTGVDCSTWFIARLIAAQYDCTCQETKYMIMSTIFNIDYKTASYQI